MKIPFCDMHTQAFFLFYQNTKGALDLALSNYFKAHKNLGANDRRQIGNTVYDMVRWQSLIDWACPPTASFLNRLEWYKSPSFSAAFHNPEAPRAAQLGLSDFLLERFTAHFGRTKAESIAKTLSTQAPTTIRANPLKTTREHLLSLWEVMYSASACSQAPHGIRFPKRLPLFSFPEFQQGLFEVQDEGSQLVALLVQPSPGEIVLDFCSGSGGKTLAIAPATKGRGQIYLHDVRISALAQAKKRCKRAGIQNAQFLQSDHSQLARLKQKCEWVLADVPCSGTGTLRRNPEQKWRIDAAMVQRLCCKQKTIVNEAISYLKPGGRLVYATCSILPEENQDQIAHFLNTHPLELEKPPLFLLPEEDGMDGFFAAVFRKK